MKSRTAGCIRRTSRIGSTCGTPCCARPLATIEEVAILDLNKKLCPDGVYTAKVDGIKVRSDGVHLTPEGVKWLTPWLEESLR